MFKRIYTFISKFLNRPQKLRTTIEVYSASDGWRWHMIADEDGKLIAESSEAFESRISAEHNAYLIMGRAVGSIKVTTRYLCCHHDNKAK